MLSIWRKYKKPGSKSNPDEYVPIKNWELMDLSSKKVGEAIQLYASMGIYIEILCDGNRKSAEYPCFRAAIEWVEGDAFEQDDAGCYKTWAEAFLASIEYAERLRDKQFGNRLREMFRGYNDQ